MNQYGIGKKSNNSVSDGGFLVFKESIAKSGHIIFYHASKEASSRFNKKINQGRESFITGRRTNNIIHKDIVVGLFNNMPEELRYCLVTAGVENSKNSM